MRAGASIFEHTRLEELHLESSQGESGWRITTSRGGFWAREVFVGTSGYTGKANAALQKKLIPIGSFIITTEILPEALARELSPRNRMIYDSKNYLTITGSHRIGACCLADVPRFFPENDQTIRRSAEILRRRHDRCLFATARTPEVEYVWGGTLDFAFDIMPHAGPDRGDVLRRRLCGAWRRHGLRIKGRRWRN